MALASRPRTEHRPYEPRGAALELMSCRTREVLLAGPANTGKSRACLEKLNLICLQKPVRAAMVRKVRATLTQAAMNTFEEKVLPEPSGVVFHTGDQEYRYPNGARIVVAGLDDPKKILSTEYDVIYVQEATELDEQDWSILLTRLRNGVLSYQQLIADCNPDDPQHWLKQRCDSGLTLLLESKHEDNPTLTDEYLAMLDTLQGYLHARLRLGLWVAAEGQYFTEWDPKIHVVDPFDIDPGWPRWLAVDYGFAVPFCCLWFARDPVARTIYVYREAYTAGLRDEQQANLIRERSEGERVVLRVLDPSMFNARGEQQRPSIASVYASCGVRPVYPGMNARVNGWSIVRRALAHDEREPRLRVMRERCPNLVRTLPSMVRDPLDPEDVADKVGSRKSEDHAVDALRYGLAAEAQPPQQTAPRRVEIGR